MLLTAKSSHLGTRSFQEVAFHRWPEMYTQQLSVGKSQTGDQSRGSPGPGLWLLGGPR